MRRMPAAGAVLLATVVTLLLARTDTPAGTAVPYPGPGAVRLPTPYPTPAIVPVPIVPRLQALNAVQADGVTAKRIDRKAAKLVTLGEVANLRGAVGGRDPGTWVWLVAADGEFDLGGRSMPGAVVAWAVWAVDARTAERFRVDGNRAAPAWWVALPDRDAARSARSTIR